MNNRLINKMFFNTTVVQFFSMLIMELAAWCKKRGETIGDALETLYQKYGYYAEDQVSVVLKGQEGAARIGRIMDAFRGNPPKEYGSLQAVEIIDYIKGYEDIPASNVLKFMMNDGSWFAMRPSGTEPKIKFYYYAVAKKREDSEARVEEMRNSVNAIIDTIA